MSRGRITERNAGRNEHLRKLCGRYEGMYIRWNSRQTAPELIDGNVLYGSIEEMSESYLENIPPDDHNPDTYL